MSSKPVALALNRKVVSFKPVKNSFILPDQLTGLEVELELRNATRCPNPGPFWREDRDGSLRSGVEYRLGVPLAGDVLAGAIHQLFLGSKFTRSTTGSTHIHLNMQEEDVTVESIRVLSMLVFCLEQALFDVGDPGREWCGYTNKLCSAPTHVIAQLFNPRDTEQGLLSVTRDEALGRYYGVNLQALHKYGSIEFRYFPTAIAAEELTNWINLCYAFKIAAMSIANLSNLAEIFDSEERYNAMLSAYFSSWKEVFDKSCPYYMARNMFTKAYAVANAQTVPYSEFNGAALTSNPVFAKWFTSAPQARPAPIIHYARMNADPTAATSMGEVMFFAGTVYISDSHNSWQRQEWGYQPPNSAERSRLLQMLPFLREMYRNFEPHLRRLIEAGWSSTRATGARSNLRPLIEFIEGLAVNTSGRNQSSGAVLTSRSTYPPPLPQIYSLDEVAMSASEPEPPDFESYEGDDE